MALVLCDWFLAMLIVFSPALLKASARVVGNILAVALQYPALKSHALRALSETVEANIYNMLGKEYANLVCDGYVCPTA